MSAFRRVIEPDESSQRLQRAAYDAHAGGRRQESDYEAPDGSGAVKSPTNTRDVTESTRTSHVLRSVAIPASGSTVSVPHLLGRAPVGHTLLSSDAEPHYYVESSDENYLVLKSTGAACNIDIEVR